MEWFAFALAVVAMIYAVFNHIKARGLETKLARLRESYDRHRSRYERFEEKARQDLAQVNYEQKKQAGKLRFHRKMTFREALAVNPKVEEVMGALHIGGCPDCAVDLNETLEYGAAKNSVDIEEFLIALNNLPESEYETVSKQFAQEAQEPPELKVI
jgi:GrpB-like predicted nucleotidyltransferase (UPF0157 family)